MQYNALQSLQAFEMGQGQRKAREEETAMKGIGNALAGGDYKGASASLFGMGKIDAGLQTAEYGKGLLDAEQEAKRTGLMRYGMSLLQTPADQREAMRPQIAQTLAQIGVELPQDQLAAMDLSDAAIQATLQSLQDPESLVKQFQAQMAPPEYFAPTEILGPDGKPTMAQFSNRGAAPKTFEGATPYQAPDQRPWWAKEDGGVDPAQLANQAAGRSPLVNINTGDGPQDTAFMKEAGSIEAKNFGSLVEMGQTARRNRVILDQLDTGAAAIPGGLEAVAKNYLGNLGISTDGLSEIQATEALINQLVPAQRAPGSGPMSDRDLALFKASLPRLIQTAEGKTRILTNMKAINDYVISEGEIGSRVLSGQITAEQGRAQMQALGNPLAGDPRTGTALGPQPEDLRGLRAPDGDPVTEEDVQETMRKYNVTREQVIAHLRGQ
jgi:hypothetical protein